MCLKGKAGMLVGFLIASCVFAGYGKADGDSRFNVVIINIDNHDKGSLSYFGNKFIETPNIDKLFKHGYRMQNYQTAGRCTSSRSAVMTGRYHARNGALGTGGAWGQTLDGVKTIAHVFKEAGYQTAMFGKWHLGDSHGQRPEDRGFDEVCSFENGAYLGGAVVKEGYMDSPRTAEAFRFNHNGTYKVYEGFRTDIWVNEINKYLESTRDKSKPFMMYFATISTHGPHLGPEDLREYYKKKYEKEEFVYLKEAFESKSKTIAQKKEGDKKKNNGVESLPYDHAADVSNVDRNVGRLMAKLEEQDLLKNTIVMYMSDGAGNGPASASLGGKPLSNFPTVVVWPGQTQGKDIEGPAVANFDVLPTFAEICGIKLSDDYKKTIDGQSFATFLGVEGATPWQDRAYINDHQSQGGREGIYRKMVLRPFIQAEVTLPDGKKVGWKLGKVQGNGNGPEVIATAEKMYKQWFDRVLESFPLGAYMKTHTTEKPVFLRSYAIDDGPGGEGCQLYFCLDVIEDGTYEFDSNVSDYFGAERVEGKEVPGTLMAFKKIVQGHLPVGYDESLDGYRVLPETLAASFTKAEESKMPGKVDLELKSGRYLLCFKADKVKKKLSGKDSMKIRVQRKL